MDLSRIDFEVLRDRFKEPKHKTTELEVLKAAIRAQMEKLIQLNKTRPDYAGKFEEQLVIFVICICTATKLSESERAEVKQVSRSQ